MRDSAQQANYTVTGHNALTNRTFAAAQGNLYCACCKKRNHNTNQCRHLDKALCTNYGRFSHPTKDCWHGSKRKYSKNNNAKSTPNNNTKENRANKKGKFKQLTNTANEKEELAVTIEEIDDDCLKF